MADMLNIQIPLNQCKDSMLFDAGTEIATYGTPDDHVTLVVHGEVRVTYDGQLYMRASEMPPELLDKFRGNWWDDEDIYVGNNNWFSFVHMVGGQMRYDDEVCEDDIANMDETEFKGIMENMLAYFRENSWT